ncbi:MAG: metal-binding protein [Methanoregula sp. PtaU1.Bin051]|nr:MAG: metal-binding protein [Methanoregula sp. PtaU1.Bin051]
MEIGAFIAEMERLAPSDLAEEYDLKKIGLIVEGRPSIDKVCCSLDATPRVVERVMDLGADMLVVHHTPIWDPITRLTGPSARILRLLLAADINLYVMHTNFDKAEGGVNDALCRHLNITETGPLSFGRIGKCSLTVEEIADRLSCSLRIWGAPDEIERLAVVAGSGFDPELMDEAAAKGADAFLSAEMKHAVARIAPLPCIEATHYALEAPAMRELAAGRNWDYIDDPPVIRHVS